MKNELTIESKNRKSIALVIIFSILTFQLTFVIILTLLNLNEISLTRALTTLGLYGILLYLVITKGLIWQLKGMRQLSVSKDNLTFTKYSPVSKKSRTYDLNKIKNFSILDSAVKEGPLAMLQLLGIADKLFLTFDYEGRTVKTISGNNLNELQDFKDKINVGLR